MKGSWIVLCGIGAAVLYGLVSHGISGSWNFSLALEIGVVVTLALSGFYLRPVEEEEEVRSKSEKGKSAEEEKKSKCEVEVEERNLQSCASLDAGQNNEKANRRSSTSTLDFDSSPVHCQPQPPASTFAPAESPEALWERARVMVHNVIPDLEEDAEYLDLVYSAAERGHVPALAKLGDYAFRRGAFVEAYFWTKVAKRRLELEGDPDSQGLKEIDDMLLNVRREWTAAGQLPEFENVYDSFPEERGELGRAFLRLDSGIEVKQTRDYLKLLADKGNPDAALFVLV